MIIILIFFLARINIRSAATNFFLTKLTNEVHRYLLVCRVKGVIFVDEKKRILMIQLLKH